MALFKEDPTGTYGAATTNYSDMGADEATGTNYTAGGQALNSGTITLSGNTAFVDFADEVFTNLTISADGALIYNASQGNKAVAVLTSVVQLHLHQVTSLLYSRQMMHPTQLSVSAN